MRIVIPGGSGQIGTILARHFHTQGHTVTVLSRRPQSTPWKTTPWNADDPGPWVDEIDGADLLINLTGRSVDCRYNDRNRRAILQSRVESTRALANAIATLKHPPRLWINAATATIYRHTFDRNMDDVTGEIGGSEPGVPETWRFSIDVATQWEAAFFAAETPGTRKIAMRSAMTMSPNRGGIFDVLLRLVRFGLGGRIGSGRQFISWIHDRDFIRAIEFLIEREDLDGAINLSSPNPLPQSQFMSVLRKAYGMPVGLPATEWMLAIGAFLIRTETELILKSRRVLPKRLTDAGFRFAFPEWPEAAADLVSRWRCAKTRQQEPS